MAERRVFTRRDFLFASGLAVAIPAALAFTRRFSLRGTTGTPGPVTIVEFTDDGVKKGLVTVPKVVKSDAEWRAQLKSDLAFDVARKGGTDGQFTGAHWNGQ